MRRRGVEVLCAHSMNEAIDLAITNQPKRVLVDMCLPDGNGLQVIAELKKIRDDVRMVVLTGHASIATSIDAIKLGAIHYLTKPAKVMEILNAFDGVQPSMYDHQFSPTSPTLDEIEWEYLQRILTECQGNISLAARKIGIHRRSLQRKLARGRPKTTP